MNFLTYAISGIDLPVSALLCFALALLLFVITRGKAIGTAAGLILTALGTFLAIAGGGDLLLLAAVELMLLCAYLFFSRRNLQNRNRKEVL